MKGRETIPVFFSTDDRYAPYLAVAIASLAKNASKEFDYRLHVLNCGLAKRNRNRLLALAGGNIALEFADVRDYLIRMGGRLHLRDYYTAATYYRFFIPDLFPAYEKGIYLDCDVAINGDIAELYGTDLGENLLGAVTEEVMTDIPTYGRYARTVLGLRPSEYFNAGVLLMNLGKMRRTGLLDRFSALLDRRRFPVAQDQDYLNLLAAGSVTYLDAGWNRTPFPYAPSEEPKLAHYKMNFKPYIDVRGDRTDEALRKIEELVDAAVMLSHHELKILHGRGNGILRQNIRQYLKTIPQVKSINDEDIRFGGDGITVVKL